MDFDQWSNLDMMYKLHQLNKQNRQVQPSRPLTRAEEKAQADTFLFILACVFGLIGAYLALWVLAFGFAIVVAIIYGIAWLIGQIFWYFGLGIYRLFQLTGVVGSLINSNLTGFPKPENPVWLDYVVGLTSTCTLLALCFYATKIIRRLGTPNRKPNREGLAEDIGKLQHKKSPTAIELATGTEEQAAASIAAEPIETFCGSEFGFNKQNGAEAELISRLSEALKQRQYPTLRRLLPFAKNAIPNNPIFKQVEKAFTEWQAKADAIISQTVAKAKSLYINGEFPSAIKLIESVKPDFRNSELESLLIEINETLTLRQKSSEEFKVACKAKTLTRIEKLPCTRSYKHLLHEKQIKDASFEQFYDYYRAGFQRQNKARKRERLIIIVGLSLIFCLSAFVFNIIFKDLDLKKWERNLFQSNPTSSQPY